MHVIKKYLLYLLDSNLERAFPPALPPQAHPGRPPTINWPCKSSEQHRWRRICPLQHHPDSASLSMPSKKMGEARDVTGSRFCCTPEGTLLDERHALGRLSTLEIFNRDTRHDFPLQILHGFMHRWVSDQIYFVSVCVCVCVSAQKRFWSPIWASYDIIASENVYGYGVENANQLLLNST